MKRNFPSYSVGLDSTMEAIRAKDYERGLEDAAKLCDDSFEFSTAIGQCAYQGNMAEAIRALKEPAPQGEPDSGGARSSQPTPPQSSTLAGAADNAGTSDRWQDSRDLSGGETDATGMPISLAVATMGMVMVPTDAWEGFCRMAQKHLGEKDRGDISPARIVELARAMIKAVRRSSTTRQRTKPQHGGRE